MNNTTGPRSGRSIEPPARPRPRTDESIDREAHGPTPHWCERCSRSGLVQAVTRRAKRRIVKRCGGCGGRGFWLDWTTLRAAT